LEFNFYAALSTWLIIFHLQTFKIEKLTRWEVIDVARTLSTEKAKPGAEGKKDK